MRRFDIGRYGLKENPVGHHVTWESDGKEYLCEVTGHRHLVRLGATMGFWLTTKYLNGEQGPEVRPADVWVLERKFDHE